MSAGQLVFKTERERKIALATAIKVRNLRRARTRQAAEGGLVHFIRYFWHVLEPNTPFVEGWALYAMCKHLEAVFRGDIKRLLINVPPGSMKSLLCNVFWPAWQWAALGRGDLRFLAFSYSSDLTERDNEKLVHLMGSVEFTEMYGRDVWLVAKGIKKPANNKRGWKLASSSGGVGTGERGNGILYDDPHNVKDGESKTVTESTVKFFRESMSDRLNDLVQSFIVVIMQRVSEGDVSGCIIENGFGYVHLCIPAEYEPDRHCTTYVNGKVFWTDPRTVEGEPYWPERFPHAEMQRLRKVKGEYAWAGQYQQRPEIRGGGVFKRDDWQDWAAEKWPKFDYILASLDPAFTAKQQNDPSFLTIWGCFSHEGESCAMLLHAWRKWLPLHGPDVRRIDGETDKEYRARCAPTCGLVETVAEDCRRFRANKLLIENKASGHDVSVEMYRLHTGKTTYEFVDPKGLDKHARAVRVQPEFSNGQIWARTTKKYAALLIDEMAVFPKGKYDDGCFVAGTFITTRKGNTPIERVRRNDEVLTPFGWRRVQAAGCTGIKPVISRHGLTGTGNHPIFSLDKGFIPMDTLTQSSMVARMRLCDLIRIIRLSMLSSTECSTGEWAARDGIISALHEKIEREPKGCTSRSGSTTLERLCRRVMRSITLTAIPLISALTIWSAYQKTCIEDCLRSTLIWQKLRLTWKEFVRLLRRGILPMKDGNGTADMYLNPFINLDGSGLRRAALGCSPASNAAKNLSGSTSGMSFVRMLASFWNRQRGAASERLSIRTSNVHGAGMNSSASEQQERSAPMPANMQLMPTEQGEGQTLTPIMPVYNLTVEGVHCYYANGVLVHNCDSATQAVWWLRGRGFLKRRDEKLREQVAAAKNYKTEVAPYDC